MIMSSGSIDIVSEGEHHCRGWRAMQSNSPCNRRYGFAVRLPRKPFAGQIVEILLPIGLPVLAEPEQVVPTVDPGRMHVVEDQPHGVIADRMHFENGDVLLARDRLALVRRMALDLGTWTLDPQIFGIELEAAAIVEHHSQRLAILTQTQLRRPRRRSLIHVRFPCPIS